MTFLNALMLFGLVAVAVPIILHLFHRQRVSTVDFSSVIFIRDHHMQRSRALRLRELLLLLLRTLIVLLLVLAFARPVIEGLAGALLGSSVEQRSVFAIILDNSYSMGAGRYGDTPFNAARTEAERIVDAMQQGDEGLIILTAAPPEALPPVPTDRTAALAARLSEAEVSENSGDIAGAVRLARRKLSGIVSANKSIFLLSDLQRSDWENLAESVSVSESAEPSESPVPIYLYPFEAGSVDNASIDDVIVSEGLLIRNQPERFVATFTFRNGVAASTNQTRRIREIRLVMNGMNRDSRQVTAETGAAGSVQFNVVIDTPGRYTGYVELDEDDVAADNRRYFTLEVPDAFGVTAVGQSESTYFIEQVLRPSGGLVTPVDVRTASADVLNSDLYDRGVLIVDGGVELTPARLSSLERYVSSGGGVLIFLGEGLDPAAYGNDFFTGVFGCSITARRGTPGSKTSFHRMDQVDFEHPVFRFDGRHAESLTTGEARFYASYTVDAGLEARVIARFMDGTPAVLEGRSGSGRALLVASDLNTGWSDLALRSAFVPFMHRSVRYLHPSVTVAEGGHLAGKPIVRPMTDLRAAPDLFLEYPSGRTETVNARAGRHGITVEVPDTRQPGVYTLWDGDAVVQVFAVNPDTRESDLVRFTPAEAAGMFGTGTNVVLMDPADAPDVPRGGTFGAAGRYEIWKSLIVFAMALILAEYWLSGSRSGRSGRAR
ncbi:MAG: BatA domain-containing protein [Gemmatimonadetes bacterium]|nr:BatA domain-containing protein [Gemmatimonadota bacterium]